MRRLKIMLKTVGTWFKNLSKPKKIALITGGILLLSVTEQASLADIIYEATSALATVGLSRSFTGNLHTAGKFIIILLMYIGRIGPITLAFALRLKNDKGTATRTLAESKIIVG